LAKFHKLNACNASKKPIFEPSSNAQVKALLWMKNCNENEEQRYIDAPIKNVFFALVITSVSSVPVASLKTAHLAGNFTCKLGPDIAIIHPWICFITRRIFWFFPLRIDVVGGNDETRRIVLF
jgi:hypothetical protein